MISIPLYTALLDANVLYPAGIRDILIQPAVYDLYRPKWSADIFHEWMRIDRRIRENHSPNQVRLTQRDLDSFFFDAQIVGYESLIDNLNLPDKDDRHVLAAAIIGDCDVIITHNIRDFPADLLEAFGTEAHSPDEFLVMLIETHPQEILESVRAVRKKLKNPAYSVDKYLDMRLKDGLVETVSFLRQYIYLLE